MVRKHFVIVIVLSVFLGFLNGCSSDPKTLKLTPSRLKFGEVNLGDTLSIDVVMKNKFGKDISISDIQITLSNDFSITAGGTLPIDLGVNEEHTITVTFDPSSNGEINGLMTFTHNASEKKIEYKMVGIGQPVPRIDISEKSYDFTYKLTNSTTDHDFVLTNTGTADLTVSNLSLNGTGATGYSIIAGGTTPAVITPNSSHTITVQFAPTSAGQYPCDLEITHDAVNEAKPFNITMTGDAFDTAPIIEVDQTSPVDYGTVAKTIPQIKEFKISSKGLSPLTITSIGFTTGVEFTLDHVEDVNGITVNLPQTVPVGDFITAFIKFAPTANSNFNDKMSIVHDAIYTSSPIDFDLSGVGRDEISKTFSYTGAAEQWTVPAGVTTIVVECYGAEGGKSEPDNSPDPAGKGGRVQATLVVTPGSTLNIYVGEKGGDASYGVVGAAGWNGGGIGSNNHYPYSGGGGGGASDIRIGGTALTDRKIVAGSGGGAGYQGAGRYGGDGGGLIAKDGSNADGWDGEGKGGTQTAGGVGGDISNYISGYGVGKQGALGTGGDASDTGIGGGGGAGYYGGGGGCWSGGGGGSSYTDPSASNVTHTQGNKTGNGEIIIKY